MTSPKSPPPFSYVKCLREIRDRIAEETADMSTEEYLRWCNSPEYETPVLTAIAARAKPSPAPLGDTKDGR